MIEPTHVVLHAERGLIAVQIEETTAPGSLAARRWRMRSDVLPDGRLLDHEIVIDLGRHFTPERMDREFRLSIEACGFSEIRPIT